MIYKLQPLFAQLLHILDMLTWVNGSDKPIKAKAKKELIFTCGSVIAPALRKDGFEVAAMCVDNIVEELSRPNCTQGTLSVIASHVHANVLKELDKIILERIPQDVVRYHDQDSLFGAQVAQKFKKARYDIKEAGNCLALERHTACVFHLMRALEYGLRALAKNLRVTLKKPVELEVWANIIREIDTEIGKIEGQPRTRTKRREKDLEFYHGAASQFRHFKNAWRNHVMHARAEYDALEARSVMVHVDEFMRHIAIRLKQ